MTALALSVKKTAEVEALLCVLGAVFIGLFAKISLFLPFTPVPVALQNFIPLVFALVLGKKRAVYMTVTWFVLGMAGLPFFAGGSGGILANIPTLGYRIGYVLGVLITGAIFENSQKRAVDGFLSLIAGSSMIYLAGVAGLCFFVPLSKVFFLGILPFIPGDLIKALLCIMICNKTGLLYKK